MRLLFFILIVATAIAALSWFKFHASRPQEQIPRVDVLPVKPEASTK